MILECQRNSYLKEFLGTVISCTADVFEDEPACNIILNDTILFPEGGGQPSDWGTLNGFPVLQLKKENGEVVHVIKNEIPIGQEVKVVVDWERRFDHMQQHTGQHLLTAMVEARFGHHTTSWNLGQETSYIELDTPNFSELRAVEDEVNERIREGVPICVDYYSPNDEALQQVKTRLELPGESTTVRVVEIKDIDRNTCCGTHVKNLSHLQVIKLLYAEKGKKGKTNLYFVVGGRVLKYLGTCVSRERTLNNLLKCGQNEHESMVEKLQKSLKLSQKRALLASRELALIEAQQFKTQEPLPRYHSFHKQDAELEFLTIFVNEVNNKTITFFLTTGDLKGLGQVMLIGDPVILENTVPRLCEILEAKGVAKNGRFQGKVLRMNKRVEAEKLVKSAFLC